MNYAKPAAAAALAATLAAQPALAGNMAAPMIEPDVIAEDTASSDGGLLIPIFLLILFAAAASSGGSDSGGGSVVTSDARLKTDITQVGMAENGLPLYQFRYIGQSTTYQGVMAQDVLAHTPEAIVTLPGGYMAVDYGMLGLEMTEVH